MQVDDITGVILAGGRSRRFGEDKAGYLVDGHPMIEHVCRALSRITDHLLLSVRNPDVPFRIPIPIVADHHPGSGPMAGLYAALRAAETPWVLLVACDMPFITSGVLRQLVDARAPDVEAVVAQTPDGRRQPLCACYNARTRPLVKKRLSDGCLSMTELLELIPRVRFVNVPGDPLRNINSPSDLTEAPNRQAYYEERRVGSRQITAIELCELFDGKLPRASLSASRRGGRLTDNYIREVHDDRSSKS